MNPRIRVASLSSAAKAKRRYDAVLTLEDPNIRNGLRFHSQPHPDHLILRFEDLDDVVDGLALPDPRHVETALAFAREHAGGSILVHCKAGVARSSAMALAIISDRMGDGFEKEAVANLLSVRPVAVPNLLVLAYADDVLGKGGRLVSAWMEIENSSSKYPDHRKLKRLILERNPALFSPAVHDIEATAIRFLPNRLAGMPGLLPIAEFVP